MLLPVTQTQTRTRTTTWTSTESDWCNTVTALCCYYQAVGPGKISLLVTRVKIRFFATKVVASCLVPLHYSTMLTMKHWQEELGHYPSKKTRFHSGYSRWTQALTRVIPTRWHPGHGGETIVNHFFLKKNYSESWAESESAFHWQWAWGPGGFRAYKSNASAAGCVCCNLTWHTHCLNRWRSQFRFRKQECVNQSCHGWT